MDDSPYAHLPPERYWRTAVAERHATDVESFFKKKFSIDRSMRIVAAGSCFAQRFSQLLRARGYNIMDEEPAPSRIPTSVARDFGYQTYSARYGNTYTARQLLQLFREARGEFEPALPVWERDGRFYDALRPGVEPDGLPTEEEVRVQRRHHLQAVRRLLDQVDVLIFTCGLTEAWVHRESGTVYPTAPGTIAGRHDPEVFEMVNFRFHEIREDFEEVIRCVKSVRPDCRFLFTLSPVPMTATASEEHVAVANTYTKSVLRAVIGDLAAAHEDVDYFPGYEMIAGHWTRGFFYEPNLRTVNQSGVLMVLQAFVNQQGAPRWPEAKKGRQDPEEALADREKCEDALLEALAP